MDKKRRKHLSLISCFKRYLSPNNSKKLGELASEADIEKERKASEQRVRRAIYQSLNHLASLGLTDFSNPKFESYAPKFLISL